MLHLEKSMEIKASPEAIWAVLGDFMNIHEFAPAVVSVDALSEGENTIGSQRRCHFDNGGSVKEEVTEWEANKRYRVHMSEMGSMPVSDAYAEIAITPIESGATNVTWSMDYTMKYGPIGWLMGQTMMKGMMGSILIKNLEGLSEKVASNQ